MAESVPMLGLGQVQIATLLGLIYRIAEKAAWHGNAGSPTPRSIELTHSAGAELRLPFAEIPSGTKYPRRNEFGVAFGR